MSIPPTVIRVKRKRVNETPVEFLQFDEAAKRHRSQSHWVYQRKDAARADASEPHDVSRNVKPVIHISQPTPQQTPDTLRQQPHNVEKGEVAARKILTPKSSSQSLRAEPRRFHISRSMMAKGGAAPGSGLSKKGRSGPAVFVERSQRRKVERAMMELTPSTSSLEVQSTHLMPAEQATTTTTPADQTFKKPRTPRARSPHPDAEAPKRAPLPSSVNRPHEDMDRITADMNQWVLNEIGANLHEMEVKQRQEKSRLKPKAPAKRYQDRHPDRVQMLQPQHSEADVAMTDASDDEGSDGEWVIDEYIRVPAHAMAENILPTAIGVLVLDGEEDNSLFYGLEDDDDDDFLEDDEDENAENHYTADYPEDEVASDDEYNRNAYMYRNHASDDEEFDNDVYHSDDGDTALRSGDNNNDEITMARIRNYMRRNKGYV